MLKREGTAVDHKTSRSRQCVRPLFQFRKTGLRGRGAMKRGPRNMAAGKERVESNIDDRGRLFVFVIKFASEIGRPQDLCGRPRIDGHFLVSAGRGDESDGRGRCHQKCNRENQEKSVKTAYCCRHWSPPKCANAGLHKSVNSKIAIS